MQYYKKNENDTMVIISNIDFDLDAYLCIYDFF